MAAGGAELAGGAQIPREKGPRRSPLSGHCHEAGLEADSGQQQHLEGSWEWPPVIVLLVIVKLFLIPFVILTYNTYDQNKTQSSAPPHPPEPSFLVGRLWAQSCRAVPLGGRGERAWSKLPIRQRGALPDICGGESSPRRGRKKPGPVDYQAFGLSLRTANIDSRSCPKELTFLQSTNQTKPLPAPISQRPFLSAAARARFCPLRQGGGARASGKCPLPEAPLHL